MGKASKLAETGDDSCFRAAGRAPLAERLKGVYARYVDWRRWGIHIARAVSHPPRQPHERLPNRAIHLLRDLPRIDLRSGLIPDLVLLQQLDETLIDQPRIQRLGDRLHAGFGIARDRDDRIFHADPAVDHADMFHLRASRDFFTRRIPRTDRQKPNALARARRHRLLQQMQNRRGKPRPFAPVFWAIGVMRFRDQAITLRADPPVAADGELVVAMGEGDDAI